VGRIIGITIGVFVILGVGVYGPATLVGPLPPATATVEDAPAQAPVTGAPTVPQTGASAIVAPGTAGTLASGGITDAVPIGGAAKVITALVALDAKPLDAGAQGPMITVTPEDYAGYVTYISQSARAVSFIAGEQWTERQFLEAMLLGSSNNHADALARWAYGSVDGYLTAASAWLTKNGLTSVQLVDATGLDEGDVGTAADLAKVAELASQSPVLAEIMKEQSVTVMGGRPVTNLADYMADSGYTGLSRSFTDQAGLCFLFSLDVTIDSGTVTLYGAFLREPDYDTLDADLAALASSAAGTLKETPVVTEGQPFVTYTTAWGETVHGVAIATESRMLWVTSPLRYRVEAKQLSSGSPGQQIGTVTVGTPTGDVSVILQLDGRIGDPGPLWRLTNPVPVISAFIDSRFGPGSPPTPTPTGS
jgi:D-alanyl-D-alanine carboxypeptidase (penicillin-binding protein 5/6)